MIHRLLDIFRLKRVACEEPSAGTVEDRFEDPVPHIQALQTDIFSELGDVEAYAREWIGSAKPRHLDWLVESAKRPEVYSLVDVGDRNLRFGADAAASFHPPECRMATWDGFSPLIEAWAEMDPDRVLGVWEPLLSHPHARKAAIWAVNSVARQTTGREERIESILRTHLGDLRGLDRDERIDFEETLAYLPPSFAREAVSLTERSPL